MKDVKNYFDNFGKVVRDGEVLIGAYRIYEALLLPIQVALDSGASELITPEKRVSREIVSGRHVRLKVADRFLPKPADRAALLALTALVCQMDYTMKTY